MSPPPTSIDGTDITGATIDGQEVQEITIDGQTVFTAIPDSEDLHLRVSALDDGRATGAITTIPDQTGNGFDFSGTAEIVSSGAFGKRSYRFDNESGDSMQVPFTDLTQPNHIFAAYQIRSIPTGTNVVIWDSESGAGGSNRNTFFLDLTDGLPNIDIAIFSGTVLDDGDADTNSHIAEGLFNGGSSSIYLDNNLVASGNAGTQALDGFTIAANGNGSQFAALDLVELLIYPQDKSAIRSDVHDYLNSRVS
jgi:hypothetical protein